MDNQTLIDLYREYSEEVWSAGWMGSPEEDEGLAKGFTDWLKDKKNRGERSPLSHYEKSAIPTLRKCWEES